MPAIALALALTASAAAAVAPHRSFHQLSTGNGHGFTVYDARAAKVTFFSEHPYLAPSPGALTRNLAFDAFFGLRADGEGAWLAGLPARAAYVEQTHVIRAAQELGPLRAETHAFAPWGLRAPALALVLRVENASRAAVADAAAYALLNFHLGSGAPSPAADRERIDWDAATGSFAETGPSGLTLRYVPFGGAVVHGANPYAAIGGELSRSDSTGVVDDAVAGFQWTLGALGAGESRWVGVVITTAGAAEARAWLSGRGGEALVADEVAAWNAWRAPAPAGVSAAELRVWRQSESVLRMAQSREPAPSAGQIVASLPPGQWSISWVRDQAYAMAALARMGHADEASRAVDFWLSGRVGGFKQQAGGDYLVSVVRYYGDGQEWSDSDQDGPNIEFDGFGLAAWAARLAGRTEMDANAGPLGRLVDSTGLIAPDSSIWERHWNGKQKRFAYTSIVAAAGLCAAGQGAAARGLRDAIARRLVLPTGGLAGSLEELETQTPARDGATVEAINFGLLDPKGPLALATLRELEKLRTPPGRGFARNDDGGGYDEQEWAFIDLRAASAFRRAGLLADADELLAWVTAQSDANRGLVAELYDRDNADAAGAIPMVGFGAGAYVLALLDRERPEARPACFAEVAPASGGCGSAGAGLVAAALVALWVCRRARWAPIVMLAACGSAPSVAPDAGPGRDGGPHTVQGPPARDCSTSFAWALGRKATHASVAGEWNRFSLTADPMSDGLGSGIYRATLQIPPGDYGYKLVADGEYQIDPSNPRTKYVGGIENSRLTVPDCAPPLVHVERLDAAGVEARVLEGAAAIDGAGVTLDGVAVASSFDAASGVLSASFAGAADGKRLVRLNARDRAGRAAEEVVAPIWTEPAPVRFSDGLLYLVMIDRFRNGEAGNDAPVAGVDARANFQGGDLAGVLAALREGYFEKLGVRTLWLSPLNAGPGEAGRGADGRLYSNYHGYWPAAPRAVEPRFGGFDDLRALTAEAHRRGLRVVLDWVQNDLHNSHPYVRDHTAEGWFHGDGSCVCGAPGCGWEERALECWFTPYLPDVDFRVTAAADQIAEDAAHWLVEGGADGFRIDAVKHMEHTALSTLRARVARLEAGGVRHLLMGEAFTGDRVLIAGYVSPRELTGQFDFPLYFAVDSVLAAGQGSMADLDAAVRAGEAAYGGAEMSPFLGNHDVPRFLSRAAGDVAGNGLEQAWTEPPAAPDRDEPYARLLLAQAFVLTQPGVPLLMFGDEYGQPGAGDPDNRRMMRFGAQLSAREAALLEKVRALGTARATHPGLRRGARRTLFVDADAYVYSRGAGPGLAIVALNRGAARSVRVDLPAVLGAEGAALRDVLGGAGATVGGGAVTLALPPLTAAVLVR